jgi:ubiquinone/menaquinone biosynthesis C-methylase UbiE
MLNKDNFSTKKDLQKVNEIDNSHFIGKYVILDFGCGDCERWNHWLKRHGGYNVIGIDLDLNRIKKAKKRIINGTSFLVCDGQYLPFKDFCFQHIHVDGVLHHSPNILMSLKEIKRTLYGTLQIGEAVDNYLLFRVSRRLLKRWRGKKITNFFSSEQLSDNIKEQFKIMETNLFFSTLGNNIISYTGISNNYYYRRYFPLFSKIDGIINSILKKFGIIKYFCTHLEILATNEDL